MNRRWRALGLGFLLTLPAAIAAGMLEVWLAEPDFPPGLVALLYGANLHALLALVAVVGARAAGWRASEGVFPRLALGVWLSLELATVVAYRVGTAPILPPVSTGGGKLAAAAVLATAVAAGVLLTRALARGGRREAWARAARGPAGRVGLVAMALLLALNGVLAASRLPRPERVRVRAGAAGVARDDVIVILIDTLRRDHLSFFGHPRPTSPHLDALLRESLVFGAAYAPSNKTIPSIAGIFSGLYPTSHGTTRAFARLPDEVPAMAEHFRSYGYRTAAFVANQTVTPRNGFGQGFDLFYPPAPPWWSHHSRTAFEAAAQLQRRPERVTRAWRITSRSLDWLAAPAAGPRFAYIHYMEPHSPYEPPARDLAAVAPDAPDGPTVPPLFERYSPAPDCIDWSCLDAPPVVSAADREAMLARYDGEIRTVDREVGRLIDALRARGVLDRAHLVLLSDHGEEFGDHGGWFHGHSIFEELGACLLAYRPPGGVPGGRVVTRPVSVLDVWATLFPLLGLEVPPLHQGRPVPEVRGEPAPPRRQPVLCELPPNLYALRLDRWKLIRRGRAAAPEHLLYDLAADPGERWDLAATLPDTLAALRAYLDGTLDGLRQVSMRRAETSLDPATLERLRSLGYVQ